MKKDVIITIPTYMREDNQILYDSLPEEIKKITYLYTHSGRYDILRANYPNANIVDLGVTYGIADVRQKVFDHVESNKFIMCDDGVKFNRKVEVDGKLKYQKIQDSDWPDLINEFSKMLDTHAQTSVVDSAIAGFNKEKEFLFNGRIYSVNGINKKLCNEAGTSFDHLYKLNNDIYLGEDFYFSLKLLTEGYPSCISTAFSFSHGHGKKGGNSLHRTADMEEVSFQLLDAEFPGIIKYWKGYDNSWNVGEDENGPFRWKTRISWSKAIKQGIAKRNQSIKK